MVYLLRALLDGVEEVHRQPEAVRCKLQRGGRDFDDVLSSTGLHGGSIGCLDPAPGSIGCLNPAPGSLICAPSGSSGGLDDLDGRSPASDGLSPASDGLSPASGGLSLEPGGLSLVLGSLSLAPGSPSLVPNKCICLVFAMLSANEPLHIVQ